MLFFIGHRVLATAGVGIESHGSFLARLIRTLLRLAHPSHAWPTSAPPCSFGRRLPHSVRNRWLRSKTRYTCHRSRTGTDRASLVRLVAGSSVHATGGFHPTNILFVVRLRSLLRVQLRARHRAEELRGIPPRRAVALKVRAVGIQPKNSAAIVAAVFG